MQMQERKPIIYLPQVSPLVCSPDGKISFKQMENYFNGIAKIPAQLELQVKFIPAECQNEVYLAIKQMADFIDEITSFVMTDVFAKIKSWELELRYKVREFLKEIELFFQKKIVEALIKIISILGIPNPFTIPIPGLQGAEVEIGPGYIETLNPVVADLFTKEGKLKIKLAIAQRKEEIKDALDSFGQNVKGRFDGTFGINAPELEKEEIWHKILLWLEKTLNNFVTAAIDALYNILTKIPIIGSLIKKLGVFIDPTQPIKEQIKEQWEKVKEKVKKAKDDVISGKAVEDLGQKIIDDFINFLLDFPIPLFGTLGDLIGFDRDEIKKREIVQSLEERLHRIEDRFEEALEKIKRFFQGQWLAKVYDIIEKAPGWILDNFPIVNKIYKTIKLIIDILRGKVPVCVVVSILLKPLFDLSNVILGFIPECVQIVETKYGIEPDPNVSPEWAVVNG